MIEQEGVNLSVCKSQIYVMKNDIFQWYFLMLVGGIHRVFYCILLNIHIYTKSPWKILRFYPVSVFSPSLVMLMNINCAQ